MPIYIGDHCVILAPERLAEAFCHHLERTFQNTGESMTTIERNKSRVCLKENRHVFNKLPRTTANNKSAIILMASPLSKNAQNNFPYKLHDLRQATHNPSNRRHPQARTLQH